MTTVLFWLKVAGFEPNVLLWCPKKSSLVQSTLDFFYHCHFLLLASSSLGCARKRPLWVIATRHSPSCVVFYTNHSLA